MIEPPIASDDGAGPLGLVRRAAAYVQRRFPLHTLGAAVAASYGCACLLYALAGPARPSPGRLAAGAATFVLLFLQLRLADDLEDARHDAAGGAEPERGGLATGFACATAAIGLLNRGQAALWPALAASGGMLLTSFVAKPWLTPPGASGPSTTDSALRDAVLGVFYEGVPVFIFLYVAAVWQSAGGALPTAIVALVVATQWTTYVFWTYARYATRPGWRPYGLGWTWVRRGLVGVLAAWFAIQVLLAGALDLSRGFVAQAGCVALGFAAWLLRVAPDAHGTSLAQRLRGALGLSFAAAAHAGIVFAYVTRR